MKTRTWWLAVDASVASVPYPTLKVAFWLTGGTSGLRDPTVMQATASRVPNGVTLALDGTVVLVATQPGQGAHRA